MFNWKKKIVYGCIALPLMLLACSNEETNALAPIVSPQVGTESGSAQTSMVVDLSCVHVDGRAVNLSNMVNGVKNEFLNFELASKVRMYELDSVTLDTTGKVWRSYILDTNGNFSFDSVSLKSPYVMIETQPAKSSRMQISPRLIIDVRKASNVSVNLLTHFESFRLRYLVQSGMPFDSAKAMAQREVLDAFGMYDESPDYDKNDDEHVKDYLNFVGTYFIYVAVDPVTESFGQNGMFRNLDSWLKDALINWTESEIGVGDYGLEPPYEYYEAIDKTDYYQYSYNRIRFAVNFLTALNGFGKCTAENEGSNYEIQEGYYSIQCHESQWKMTINGFKQVEYSTGTMTDNRNGKMYKTVTYNIDGSPLTVMAENLDYGNGEHKEWCLDLKPKNHELNYVVFDDLKLAESSGCGVYGGMYRAYDAFMLDTTFFRENVFDSCVANYVKYWRSEGPAVIDSNQIRESCYYTHLNEQKITAWADSVEKADGHVQGICPDGWHIPTSKEWRTLWKFLDGVSMGDSLLGDPSGFGLKNVARVDEESGFVDVKGDIYFAMKPEFLADYQYQLWAWSYKPRNPEVGYGVGIVTSFVRCMKN